MQYMDRAGKMQRTESTRDNAKNRSTEPGALTLKLAPGQSVVCHKPGHPFDKAEITFVRGGNGAVELRLEGDSYEFWRRPIYDNRLKEWVADQIEQVAPDDPTG